MLHGLCEKVSSVFRVCGETPGCYAGVRGGNTSVTRGPCGLGWMPWGSLCGVGSSVGVKTEDEGLGQPRQVTTSGTHGPSGRLIFNLGGRCEAATT